PGLPNSAPPLHCTTLPLALRSLFLPLFFYCFRPHPHLHSFPTRRSSDLASVTLKSAAWSSRTRMFSTSSPTYPASVSVVASARTDRKSTRLNSSHQIISYAVFCLKKNKMESGPAQLERHLGQDGAGIVEL